MNIAWCAAIQDEINALWLGYHFNNLALCPRKLSQSMQGHEIATFFLLGSCSLGTSIMDYWSLLLDWVRVKPRRAGFKPCQMPMDNPGNIWGLGIVQ